jgi:hypothetical protein
MGPQIRWMGAVRAGQRPPVDLGDSGPRCSPRSARPRQSGVPAHEAAATSRAAETSSIAPPGRRRRRPEQEAGLAVADQLAVAADVGGHQHIRPCAMASSGLSGVTSSVSRIGSGADRPARRSGRSSAAPRSCGTRPVKMTLSCSPAARPGPSDWARPAARRRPAAGAARDAGAAAAARPRAAGPGLRRRRTSR